MQPWIVDADDISPPKGSQTLSVAQTPEIKSFLRDDFTRFIITGTKGYGKTLLLKAKRLALQENMVCLPSNSLLDKPVGDKTFARSELNTLTESAEPWKRIWRAAVCASVLKKQDALSTLPVSSFVQSFFSGGPVASVADYFVNILALSHKQRTLVVEETDTILIPALRNLGNPVAVFIDSVDEYFKKHLTSESDAPSAIGEVSPEIWHLSQMGLAQAVYELRRVNHHLKLYATMRKEAFARLSAGVMSQQYEGIVVDLAYSKDDLREIFNDNIAAELRDNLMIPAEAKSHPIRAFLGVEKLENSYTGSDEEAFDYIYRHTFQRPRDLMTIGSKLSALPVGSGRSAENIKRAVNEASHAIAREYLAEVNPHLGNINFPALWGLLVHPVLSPFDIDEIAARYPENLLGTCGDGRAMFARLYRAGLVGVTVKDAATAQTIQKFIRPGAVRIDSDEAIPESPHYLIHPALTEHVGLKSAVYAQRTLGANIIGSERPWHERSKNTYSKSCFVLKADIVEFGKIMEARNDGPVRGAMTNALQKHAKEMICHEIVHGDSFVIVDASADHLIRCARGIQAELYPLNGNPELRIAVVHGEVQLEEQDDDVRVIRGGDALRVAARVEGRVPPSRIWVDSTVKKELDREQSYYTTKPAPVLEGLECREDGAFNVAKMERSEKAIWIQLFEVVGRG